jgi:hypothetical protein
VEALPDGSRVLATTHQSLDEVIDVDGVQPDWLAANRSELPALYRPEEAKQMEITRPVDEPWPGDNCWKALPHCVSHQKLGFRLGLLIDVCRIERSCFVRCLIASRPKDTGCAAVSESFQL